MKKKIFGGIAFVALALALFVGISSASASSTKFLVVQAAGIPDGTNQALVGFSIYDGTDYTGDDSALFSFSGITNTPEFHAAANNAILTYASNHSYSITADDIVWSYQANNVTPTEYWHNGVVQTSAKHITFTGTTTSGQAVFYLTDDGLVGGNALCASTPNSITVNAVDASNTFGLGYAVTNSNKTLTITANVRNFSSTTILGISVLGSSSLAAAPNDTALNVAVDCN